MIIVIRWVHGGRKILHDDRGGARWDGRRTTRDMREGAAGRLSRGFPPSKKRYHYYCPGRLAKTLVSQSRLNDRVCAMIYSARSCGRGEIAVNESRCSHEAVISARIFPSCLPKLLPFITRRDRYFKRHLLNLNLCRVNGWQLSAAEELPASLLPSLLLW